MARNAGFWDPEDGTPRHPAVITAAAPSLEDEHRARVRKYTILMAFRIPCLVLAAWAYSVFSSAWISIAIIAVSIPLPWMAVLIANDRPPRRKHEPSRWHHDEPATDRPAIERANPTIEG